jgi:hypothetical protein
MLSAWSRHLVGAKDQVRSGISLRLLYMLRAQSFLFLIVLGASTFACGCTASKPQPKLTSISTNFHIKVKNPVIKQLTIATEDMEIDATGEFAPGAYNVRGTQLLIAPGTTFRLSLRMPIKNPNFISTADANGLFQTSQPLVVHGVVLPKDIAIKDGRVTGEFDLVHMLGSFFINVLQVQKLTPAEGSDAQQFLSTMHIGKAQLNLRPDATLCLGSNKIHTRAGSSVCLSDLTIDKNLDYRGTCKLKLHFAPNCAYIEDKVDALFNGGQVDDTVSVERKNSTLTLAPISQRPAPRVTLADCTYKFGKNKSSTAHCANSVITISKFDWANYEAENVPSDYHFDTRMDVTGTRLRLSYPTYSVDAFFPETEPAALNIFHDKKDHGLDFATHDILAKIAAICIIRPSTSIKLDLEEARLGSINFSKSGDLDFQLSTGTSQLKSFEWSNGKKKFRLTTNGGSTVAVTGGSALSLNKDHTGAAMKGQVPLSVKLGEASLANAEGNVLNFKKINGEIVVDIDKEVSLTGKADISITQCDLLGDTPADVDVRGFRLRNGDGRAVMSLAGCTVVVPKGAIAMLLKKNLPDEKSFDFKQEIFDEKKWRYKNAVITKLILRKPLVQQFTLVSPGKATFSAGADIEVDGTVEKTGIFGAFKKDPKNWETKDWKAFSHCTGNGALTFKISPNKTLADSDMTYDLNLQMPLPQDIKVDWSQVSSGIVRKAETSVISGYLNKCEPFHGSRTIPFSHKGTIKLFQAKNEKLQAISISKFDLKPTDAGTEIHFVGEASL